MMDWRLYENRREAFLRFCSFQLQFRGHPGAVYQLLPAIAKAYDLDDDGRSWLTWLNGNTENAVTSLLLLEAAPGPDDWRKAVDFWNDHFTELEWDMDRRHQKARFGEATEKAATTGWELHADGWFNAADMGWPATWKYAAGQPYMGRMSSWSMIEYARILMGDHIPDADSFLLEDKSGSRSHRNGLAVVGGYPAAEFWDADTPDMLGIVPALDDLAEDLLDEMRQRFSHSDLSRLTMESALCTYKSWHKPNRRYPNVYHDMMYKRILRGEKHFGPRFDLLWDTRRAELPRRLLLECSPRDPGVAPVKQNWYRETGEIHYLHLLFDDMEPSGFEDQFDE